MQTRCIPHRSGFPSPEALDHKEAQLPRRNLVDSVAKGFSNCLYNLLRFRHLLLDQPPFISVHSTSTLDLSLRMVFTLLPSPAGIDLLFVGQYHGMNRSRQVSWPLMARFSSVYDSFKQGDNFR